MKRLTDPSFKYTPAGSTDIAKTFARIRRQLKERQAHDAANYQAMQDAAAVMDAQDLPAEYAPTHIFRVVK